MNRTPRQHISGAHAFRSTLACPLVGMRDSHTRRPASPPPPLPDLNSSDIMLRMAWPGFVHVSKYSANSASVMLCGAKRRHPKTATTPRRGQVGGGSGGGAHPSAQYKHDKKYSGHAQAVNFRLCFRAANPPKK